MKCPLFGAGYIASGKVNGSISLDCLKEECAWWDLEGQFCIALSAGIALINIDQRLKQLVEKMPHADQFTK